MISDLKTAFRLGGLLPVGTRQFSDSARVAAALAILYVLVRLGFQALAAAPDIYFELWSVPYFVTLIAIELAMVLGVAALFARKVSMAQVFVAYMSWSILFTILWTGVGWVAPIATVGQWSPFLVFMALFLVFLTRLPQAVPGATWRLSSVLGCAIVAGLALQAPFFDYRSVFVASYDAAEDTGYSPVDVERLYYEQGRLMQAQLSKVNVPPSDAPRLFSVVVGGTSYQRVFQREVHQVASAINDRFGGNVPQIQLLNSQADPFRFPLANRPNLEAALTATARAMDPSKDVALIYLTSHGSEDRFSLAFPEASTTSLNAHAFSQMLNRSGIPNAVIIISACYSGSFIDDIAAPDRAILTAADAESTSFGCSDESEWTWFGKAFFENALQKTRHFGEAFVKAKQLVTDWEAQQGFAPSNPQIFVGHKIAPLLGQLGNHVEKLASLQE
jgi:hypothetical protein